MAIQQRQNNKPKIYVRIFLNVASISLLFGSIAFTAIFIYLNAGTPEKVLAGSGYYTRQNAEWSQNSLWATGSSNGTACNCNIGCSTNQNVFIHHSVLDSFCNPIKFSSGAKIYIERGGKLTLLHGMEVRTSQVTIDPNDSLIIYGNVLLSGGSKIKDNGYLKIYGNLNLTGNSTIDGNGVGVVTGTIKGSGWNFLLDI